MSWMMAEAKRESTTRAIPKASIGYGRVDLNVAACELIDNVDKYSYAQLMLDSDSDDAGIVFLESFAENAIRVKRKKSKGKKVGGITLSSKDLVREVFGLEGVERRTTRRRVVPSQEESNVLVVKPCE